MKKIRVIIIMFIILLLILLIILLKMLDLYKKNENQISDKNGSVVITVNNTGNNQRSVREIIEDSGSKYISDNRKVRLEVFLEFKYKLFDENGKSKKSFFYNIIDEIKDLNNSLNDDMTFLLIDKKNNIEISAIYNPDNKTYKVLINGIEDFYDKVDGEVYNELANFKNPKYSDLSLDNQLIKKIGGNNSKYQNTELITDEKEKLDNGYYSFYGGTILAKLQDAKALNIIFKQGYKDKFTTQGIYVGTKLEEILKEYPNNNFGSIKEGYLGYITEYAYIFFYEDEVSVYPCLRNLKRDNNYFDEYIKNYCISGNLENLVSDFGIGWNSYFEKEVDLENQSFKISFPVRGIKIDIINNNSAGITLYSNYKLSDDIKNLVLAKKITLKGQNDLVDVTERARRESM